MAINDEMLNEFPTMLIREILHSKCAPQHPLIVSITTSHSPAGSTKPLLWQAELYTRQAVCWQLAEWGERYLGFCQSTIWHEFNALHYKK